MEAVGAAGIAGTSAVGGYITEKRPSVIGILVAAEEPIEEREVLAEVVLVVGVVNACDAPCSG